MKMIALGLLLAATTSLHAQSTRTVDPTASKFLWTGKKVTGEHTGGLTVKSGTVGWGANGLTAADITIDMRSITCTDMSGGGAERFVAHLHSADFFDTEKHPTAHFVTTQVEPIAGAKPGQPNYKVTGDLTIKGITKPVTFDALAWQDGANMRAAANLVFDRTAYDIRYRSVTFFQEIGDKAIENDVALTFDLTAK